MERLGIMLNSHGSPALVDWPRVAALDALRLVHAKQRAAFQAGPLGCLLGDESPCSHGLDARQVREDAYSVFSAIAAVKTQQICAGIPGAGNAKSMAAGCKFLTILDGTCKTHIRLVAVTASATGAGVAVSNECAAQAAIHATWRHDHRIICLNSLDLVRHAVPPIPAANSDLLLWIVEFSLLQGP